MSAARQATTYIVFLHRAETMANPLPRNKQRNPTDLVDSIDSNLKIERGYNLDSKLDWCCPLGF